MLRVSNLKILKEGKGESGERNLIHWIKEKRMTETTNEEFDNAIYKWLKRVRSCNFLVFMYKLTSKTWKLKVIFLDFQTSDSWLDP